MPIKAPKLIDKTSFCPHILLIDDNQQFIDSAFMLLASFPLDVVQTAEEGFLSFYNHNPDIILLDIGLPDGSGHEVLKAIMRINKDAFVVMLTASTVPHDLKLAIQAGASGYISKPFTQKKLHQLLGLYQEYLVKNPGKNRNNNNDPKKRGSHA